MTQQAETMERLRAKMMEGANLYALSDKSDPFALARAMMHLRNGIAEPTQNKDGVRMCYEATPYQEERFYEFNGERVNYHVTVYRNVARP